MYRINFNVIEFNKFFEPSPRKHRLTVYRGPQVLVPEMFVIQGVVHACHHDGFHDLGTFDEAPGTVQSPGVRADAQCCKIDILKWLEELVSQSNTIQAQEDITEQGRLQARSG